MMTRRTAGTAAIAAAIRTQRCRQIAATLTVMRVFVARVLASLAPSLEPWALSPEP